jgi:hypothetical protein
MSQFLGDVSHANVKDTANDYRIIVILFDDILRNFCFSYCPFSQVLLLSWLKIPVDKLDILVAEILLSAAEIRSECLHELELGVVS